jgi:hypothetical protein
MSKLYKALHWYWILKDVWSGWSMLLEWVKHFGYENFKISSKAEEKWEGQN